MLISMAVWDTEQNNRSRYTQQTVMDLLSYLEGSGHELAIYNQGSCKQTGDFLRYLSPARFIHTIHATGNIGTAAAINFLWKTFGNRHKYLCKMDNDVIIEDHTWMDQMEEAMSRSERSPLPLGILGLKRNDLEERPDHMNQQYRSRLAMLPHERGESWIVVEMVKHVMGTCCVFGRGMRDKIGYLYQGQDVGNVYGFDDSLASLRARIAGYGTALLPHIKIRHIDEGGDVATIAKAAHAANWMPWYQKTADEYMKGTRPLYWEDVNVSEQDSSGDLL